MSMNIGDLDAVKRLIEPIVSEITNLSSRIAQNRSAVSASETATRNQLIEPLMRVLGWDASDPNLVTPEYSAGHGRVDYALMENGKPIVLIEAKKLGTKLTAGTLLQAFGYVDDASVKFVVISNGDSWEVHRIPLTSRALVATFAISSASPHSAALDAAKLARQVLIETAPSFSDRPSRDMATTATGSTASNAFQSDGVSHEQPETEPIVDEIPRLGWVTLEKLEFHDGARRPHLMQLPDGTLVQLSSWKQLWIEIAEWITANYPVGRELSFGHLDNMAVRTENIGFWKDFGYQLRSGYWVARGTINTQNSVKYARQLLRQVGQDESNVLFKFE